MQLRKERNITQIAQALVNCHYFEKTVALYEEYIREMGITHVHVNHHPAFQNCLQKLEELIYRCNEIAIDEEFDNLLATLDVYVHNCQPSVFTTTKLQSQQQIG